MADWNSPSTNRQAEAQSYLESYAKDSQQARADLLASIHELERLKSEGARRASILYVEQLITLIQGMLTDDATSLPVASDFDEPPQGILQTSSYARSEENDIQKILVIDDDFHNRHVICLVAENMGFTTIEAENGHKGLEALAQHEFGLAFIDLEMPHLRGDAMLKIIRENPAWQNLPVIIITGHHHMVAPEVEELASYVLLKPIDILHVKQLMSRILGELHP